jgi:hypothetical protein
MTVVWVKQRHLSPRVGNVECADQLREIAGERRLARIEIVAGHRAAAGRAISVLPTRGCCDATM